MPVKGGATYDAIKNAADAAFFIAPGIPVYWLAQIMR